MRTHRLAHLARAHILNRHGRWAEAEKEARLALAGGRTHAAAFVTLCIALLNQEKMAEAEQAANQAIAATPEWGEGYSARAAVFKKKKGVC